MVHKVHNPKLRIAESTQFFGDVLNICKQSNPAELNIKTQWSELETSYKTLNERFKKTPASLKTAELATLDERRDNAIVCLRKLADGYTNHHDGAKKQAGKQLLIAIDKYGKSISRMNYPAETSVLDNLVVDLKNEPDNAAAIKLTGLADTVAEIKSANDLFNQTYLERVGEAAEKDLNAAGEVVQECRLKYNALIKHIEAHATIHPSEAYDALIRQLNNLIDKFNTMLAQRGNRDHGEGEDMSPSAD
jgi:hypothetical protein